MVSITQSTMASGRLSSRRRWSRWCIKSTGQGTREQQTVTTYQRGVQAATDTELAEPPHVEYLDLVVDYQLAQSSEYLLLQLHRTVLTGIRAGKYIEVGSGHNKDN